MKAHPSYRGSPVGELASSPGARRVFDRLGIDYCCGGYHTLAEACAAAGVPLETAIAELERIADADSEGETDWKNHALAELVDHILERYHSHVRTDLERIAELQGRVEQAHGRNHPALPEIREILARLRAELLPHMEKEELILFPFIGAIESAARDDRPRAAGPCIAVAYPIRRMQIEHEIAGELLAELRRASSGYTPPPDACPTFAALYEALAAFERDLREHIRLENGILFPRAIALELAPDRRGTPEVASKLGA